MHVQVEAKRLAYEDRARYYADPHFAKIPIEWLNSKEYAAERAKLIRLDRILTPVYPGQAPSHGDTTYFTTADKDGMMVSMIQSNFRGMGSGLVADGLGFMFQDRGRTVFAAGRSSEHLRAGQAAVPDHHSRLCRRGTAKPWMSFGVMGGDMQPQGQTQIIIEPRGLRAGCAGRGRQPALAPRGLVAVAWAKIRPGLGPMGLLRLEAGVPEATRQARSIDLGWPMGASDGGFGRYECIEHRMSGADRFYAAGSEMRADGVALAY